MGVKVGVKKAVGIEVGVHTAVGGIGVRTAVGVIGVSVAGAVAGAPHPTAINRVNVRPINDRIVFL